MASVFQDILEAVQTKLRALDLTGVDDANILIREIGSDAGVTLPGILIVPKSQAKYLFRVSTCEGLSWFLPVFISIPSGGFMRMSMSSEKREIRLNAFESEVPPLKSKRGPSPKPLNNASRVQQTQKSFSMI